MSLDDIKTEFHEVIRILMDSVGEDAARYGELGEEIKHSIDTCIDILELVREEVSR